MRSPAKPTTGRAIWWFLLLILVIVGALELSRFPTKDVSQVLYVTGSVVNVREGPSTQFPVVTKVKKGHRVTAVFKVLLAALLTD